jgi:hypothetical protein
VTGKADLTPEEWETVVHGPTTAGLIVVTAQSGGTFREMFAITKLYAEVKRQPGSSELVDEIVAARPALDHTRYRSPDELREGGLRHLAEAIDVLERKASLHDLTAYRSFVLELAERVANAHREGGVAVSDAEQGALDAVRRVIDPAG